MGSIFLSHNSVDKPFVRKLASDINKNGHYAWVDMAEIKVGDSLIGKIEEGIMNCDYLGVVLSTNSIKSEWVTREVRVALSQEICGRKVKVLPILLEKVQLPLFLMDKLYADFTEEDFYESSLFSILSRLSENPFDTGNNQNLEERKKEFRKDERDCKIKETKEPVFKNINIIEKNSGIVAGDNLQMHY